MRVGTENHSKSTISGLSQSGLRLSGLGVPAHKKNSFTQASQGLGFRV